MPTKAVTARQKDSQAIVAAGKTHAPALARKLASTLKPYVKKGEELPDIELMVTLLTRMLGARHESMVAADEAHERELGDDSTPRDARDTAAAELGKHLVDLREILVGMFGTTAVRSLGFTGTVPRDPVVLVGYAGEISSGIRSASLRKPRIKGAEWKPSEVADQLDELRGAVKSALDSVARELREAQGTLEAKNKAVSGLDDTCAGVAEVLGGLLRLSGNVELADKLWPVTRRAVEAPASPAEPEAPAAGGASPAR